MSPRNQQSCACGGSLGSAVLLGALVALAGAATANAAGRSVEADIGPTLIACADPNDMPFSNAAREGFENRIAELIAADLGVKSDSFWLAGHRTFLRRTLLDGMCDAVISFPPGVSPAVVTTRPYFASSFVTVTRADDSRRFNSFDDPWLKDARIGLQLVGAEGATTPPAIALADRGLSAHIVGFRMWAEDGVADPQGRIVDAVADGTIDVAFVWGPFGAWFARRHGEALRVTPVLSDPKRPDLQFVFPMAIAVRKSDAAFRDRLQVALDRRSDAIAAILRDAGVPLQPVPDMSASADGRDAPK